MCTGVMRESWSPPCFRPEAPSVTEPVRPVLPTCHGPHAPRLLRGLPLSWFLPRSLVSILLVCLSLLEEVVSTSGGSGRSELGA